MSLPIVFDDSQLGINSKKQAKKESKRNKHSMTDNSLEHEASGRVKVKAISLIMVLDAYND